MEQAVLDRIEDQQAIVLVGEQEQEYILAASALPTGATEGAILLVKIVSDSIEQIQLDQEKTNNAKARIKSKMSRLRRK
ncbi:DUF3006 domain-containing protein [Gracilibacillus sp. S3-1-1]|uniref:DUF3006 domain-containing protein n=1 Tax=Gracilibacillus pellucidus TaxID=3095368 RepID=A0ACC6M2Y2_9BACI|nr:DUF3006 domain-containing protein [Gracilibacillus sp. S3-1-1]MDX8045289.1 DUF3006 domain-containing protein [Gracilibacillus sp. S3-1-1]